MEGTKTLIIFLQNIHTHSHTQRKATTVMTGGEGGGERRLKVNLFQLIGSTLLLRTMVVILMDTHQCLHRFFGTIGGRYA